MFRQVCFLAALAMLPSGSLGASAQGPQQSATAVPHQTGTVKATGADSFTITTSTGQDVAVAMPGTAKVVVVAPGAKTLAGATAGSLTDVAQGDRALVTGTPGDSPTAMTATRVVLMKSSALADAHAAEEAAWAQGAGGIVKSVDPATGTIIVASGMKTLTVQATPATTVKRYAGDSVRFQDAVAARLADIRPGDQLRVRGNKSADGTSIQADAVVAGTFAHYSGLISAIDPSAGTITLKDLASKRLVTVAVTPASDVHRLPPMVAMRIAAGMRGATSGPATSDSAAQTRRAGSDLSSMISRLPTETLGGLKTGEAVMIVAAVGGEKVTAVTLLVGVDPILTAPAGETMTISPWSIGGSSGDAGAAGGGR
jgi:hypothetical protein